MKKTTYILLSLIIIAISSFSVKTLTNQIPESLKNSADGLYAVFNTSKGEIICFLEHEKAPLTVANFVGLAEGKIKNTAKEKGIPFYDGLTFHRFTKDFVIQGGDPNADGSGNPGYKFYDEFNQTLTHNKEGILSMANSGANTNGCQFFITLRATPHLDNKHSIFGKVVKGIETVREIREGDKINSVKIIRKGQALKSYDPLKINVTITTEDFFIRQNN